MLLALIVGCGFDPHAALRSDDLERRRRAVVWMDREELRRELPELLRMAEADPSETVRREVLRNLGWTRDPAALPVLEAQARAFPAEVLTSFVGWGEGEGCRRAAAVEIPHDERVYRWYLASPCFGAR